MPAKKSTIPAELESLGEAIERLRKDVDQGRKAQGYVNAEADRTRRGTTRANQEAARAHRRVDGLEERTGILESASNAVINSMTGFIELFQTRVSNLNADSAKHEQQITKHEQQIKGLEKATSSNNRGSIFATWLAVVVTVVGGMLIAHNYLAERYTAFYQGRTIDIGAHPGYDAIFWAASIIAVLATTVAALASASSNRSSTKTNSSRHAASVSATASSADSIAVSEDYVFVETTPTEVTPVVRV